MSSSRLLEAARVLGLSQGERGEVEGLEHAATAAYPAELSQLHELVDEPEAKRRYRELALQAPDMLHEETAWLADLVRQALIETERQVPWVVLYLLLAHEVVLGAKLEHRLNSRAALVMPSPFVYAMQ